jgi:SAM-dependent methyltransferase
MKPDDPADPDFLSRRIAAASETGRYAAEVPDWFEAFYKRAGGDAAQVPWADLGPKRGLPEWLADHPGEGRTALDIGCGLGDNAEAIAAAGYATTAFDLSEEAIAWARKRFPDSPVSYAAANLFDPPPAWRGAFDLVNEIFTIQALDGDMRRDAFAAIASFLAPGGRLLMITLIRDDGTDADGPPWPLTPSEIATFEGLGLHREESYQFDLDRRGRVVPHLRIGFVKS